MSIHHMTHISCFAVLFFAILPIPAQQAEAQIACYDCHGSNNPADYRPVDSAHRDIITGGFQGNHRTHMDPAATPASCAKCHSGSDEYTTSHRDWRIDISPNINNSPAMTIYANGSTSFNQTPTPQLGTCRNVNCHFETTTPVWGSTPYSGPGDCNGCHSVPGASGVHAKHDGYFPFSANGCTRCHPDYKTGLKFSHATSAGHTGRGIHVLFSTGTYNGTGLNYQPSQSGSRVFGNCSDTYCHSNGASVATTTIPANTTPLWNAEPLTCDGCHGTPPGYTGGSPKANSHPKHVTDCSICHFATTTTGTSISDPIRHVNTTYDLQAKTGYTFSYTFSAGGGTCTNISCHFDGTAQWGTTLGCAACHGADASSGNPIATGKHTAHTNNAAILGVNFGCIECHAKTVSGNTTIANLANHANGLKDYSGAKAGGSANYNATTHVCSALYCHSDGKGTTRDMGTFAWTSAATLDCRGCHGSDASPAFASLAGEPNYANAGAGAARANSHEKHAKAGASSCDACHTDTTTSGTAIKSGSALHVNVAIDVTFNPAKAGSTTWTAGTKTCGNISCHTGASAVWGATMPADCTGCHGNDATSANVISTGKHRPHLDNYTTLGRNNNFACTECHATTLSDNRTIGTAANHANGMKNYSGARAGQIASAGTGSCTTVYCHSSGMKTNQYWNMSSANWYSGRTVECNGCHGTAMLPDGTAAAYASVAGEPVYANFTAQGRRNSHNRHITRTGIVDSPGCAKCHATTIDGARANKLRDYSSAHLDQARTVAFLPSLQGRYSTATQECLNLYCHSPGTRASNVDPPLQSAKWGSPLRTDCSGCHKGNSASFRWMSSGSHNRHISPKMYTPYRIDCVKCHAATVNPGLTIKDLSRHVSKTLEIAYDNTSTAVNGKYAGAFAPVSKNPGSGYGSCDNVYCHSNGQNDGGVGITYKQPTWGNSATGRCGTCHDAQVSHAGSSPSQISTGSHTRHLAYNSLATTSVRKCILCHNLGNLPYTGSCTNTCHTGYAKHVDRRVSIVVPTELGPSAQYNGSPIPGSGYSTCSNTYCHSNGTSVSTGTVPTNTSPAWGSGAMACSGCHGYPPNYASGTPKTNSHAKHSGFTCNKCHANTTADGTTISSLSYHVNKVFNVNAGGGATFTYAYNAAGGSCSSISCHFNGTAQWGTTIACGSCHPATGGTMTSGSHPAHLADARGPNADCDSCHGTGAATGQHTGHANGVTDFSDGNALASTTACNTCHSPGGTYDGVNNAVFGAKGNWALRVYSSNSIRAGKEKWCASCHDESPSVISGVTASNVVGNESGAYTYGTGWGYYKTGHGLPSGGKYPASGGVTAGAAVECGGCHDNTTGHIDGLARTYDDGESTTLDPSYYRQGYRLKLVDAGQGTGTTGREPLLVPAPVTTANSANNHRLCVDCHAAGPFVDSGDMNTNLVTDGVNRHEYHLKSTGTGRRVSADWSNTAACSSDWTQCNSRMTCTSCHNVHGSTRLAMINDGKLVAREPGLNYWYYTSGLVTFDSPPDTEPTPVSLPLTASAGTVWSGGSSSNLCSHCHGNTWLTTESRAPFQNVAVAPTLAWTGTAGYASDGVNPDTAGGGSSFTFRVRYADGNNDAPGVYQVWIDKNDSGAFEADEKFDMSALDGADLNYFDGKIYTYATQLYMQGDNTLNYRFYFRDASSDATGAPASDRQVTVTNSLPTLSWTGETDYATDGVDPDIGGNGSTFTFRVKYADPDNVAPDADGVRVLINGTYHALDAEAGGSYDTGKIYSKGIALGTAGDLNYRFVAKDPAGASATGDPASDHLVTVLESSNNPPLLEWTSADCLTEGVRPRTGAKDADFEFRVRYSDPDNECPTSIRVTVNGTPYDLTGNDGASCQTGRTYYRTMAIASTGDLNYSFAASDGADAATGTPVADHVVSVIDTAYKLRPTGGSGWYSDLATAYNATPASGTLLVYPNADFTAATYTGGLSNINKTNRTLQSVCGADFTIISGGSNVITLQGNDGAVIDGFGITGGTAYGIYSNSDSLTLKNSKVYSNPTGVHLNNGCNPVSIQDTEIYGNISYGINSPSTLNLVGITSSNIHDNSGSSGAGISLNGGAGAHTITATSFTANSASTNGGAIYCVACTVSIDDSTFRSNTAGAGGAIYLLNASVATITDTFIQGNSVTGSGGGINVANAAATANLTNVIMTGNKASSNGGAVFLQGAINGLFSTVSGNYAGNLGGGVYNNSTAVSTVKNSIMYNNDAASGADNKQIYSISGKEQYLTLYYTLISQAAGGTGSYSYTDGGNNDTSGNPDFLAPIANLSSAAPTTGGDFHLNSSSPAINAASAAWTSDHDIFDGTAGSRPKGGAYDMGAHEKE